MRGLPRPEAIEARQPWLGGLGMEDGQPGPRLPGWLRVTRVVLACAHLDHDPGHNRPRNLAALCQRCHMLHDAPEHRRTRWRKRFARRAAGALFH